MDFGVLYFSFIQSFEGTWLLFLYETKSNKKKKIHIGFIINNYIIYFAFVLLVDFRRTAEKQMIFFSETNKIRELLYPFDKQF